MLILFNFYVSLELLTNPFKMPLPLSALYPVDVIFVRFPHFSTSWLALSYC